MLNFKTNNTIQIICIYFFAFLDIKNMGLNTESRFLSRILTEISQKCNFDHVNGGHLGFQGG